VEDAAATSLRVGEVLTAAPADGATYVEVCAAAAGSDDMTGSSDPVDAEATRDADVGDSELSDDETASVIAPALVCRATSCAVEASEGAMLMDNELLLDTVVV